GDDLGGEVEDRVAALAVAWVMGPGVAFVLVLRVGVVGKALVRDRPRRDRVLPGGGQRVGDVLAVFRGVGRDLHLLPGAGLDLLQQAAAGPGAPQGLVDDLEDAGLVAGGGGAL